MTYKNIFLLTSFTAFFTACAPQYNLTPIYDKKNKIVQIDDLNLNNITSENTKNKIDRTGTNTKYSQYKLNDTPCYYLNYKVNIAGQGRYYHTSVIEDTLLRYNNDCEVEKIANLNFSKCLDKQIVIENSDKYVEAKMNYAISSSISNDYGYRKKSRVRIGNNYECYEKIKKHFKLKTDHKYITITNKFKKD